MNDLTASAATPAAPAAAGASVALAGVPVVTAGVPVVTAGVPVAPPAPGSAGDLGAGPTGGAPGASIGADPEPTASSVPPSGETFVSSVRIRWSDLDAFGHVNNARTLTLLEEARVDWLFTAAARVGANRLTEGIVVARAEVDYLRPIGFGAPAEVTMWISRLRASSAVVGYHVDVAGVRAAAARTTMVPIELTTGRARRWDQRETDFLTTYLRIGE